MFGTYRDNKTPNERYLQDELDRLREEQERDRQEREEQREERLRELRARGEQNLRSAGSWREALQKQVYLFNREVDEYDAPPYGNNYFRDGRDACQRALEIWPEVEAEVSSEIAELEAKIQVLRDGIRRKVSGLLMAEANDRQGWRGTASAISTEEDFEAWLDW